MQKDHFPFIYCVESLVYEGDYDQWETCFTKLNLDPKPVKDCYGSGYGEKVSSQKFSVLIYCFCEFILIPIHCMIYSLIFCK